MKSQILKIEQLWYFTVIEASHFCFHLIRLRSFKNEIKKCYNDLLMWTEKEYWTKSKCISASKFYLIFFFYQEDFLWKKFTVTFDDFQ
jgi:hypothetical protein